jgi:TolB-like protein/DNA-binding winged helix-turn-helix (wHTH) protein
MTAPDTRVGTKFGGGFRLGDLRVNPQTGEVAGPGGQVQLDPKVMGVLVMLAERAGEVVPREEFHARLWPDLVVTDDALSRCLYDLRRELAGAGGSDDYRAFVETLPKRGYRLNAAVSHNVAPVSPSRSGSTLRRWVGVAALAVIGAGVLSANWLAPTRQASVAVIPFTDMSPDRDQGYFADGVAEEILNRLWQSKGLRVIGRTSSFSMRGEDLDVREIARRLGVTHVLEGSVRKSGDDLRITAQLISGKDGLHVWSHTFEKRYGDLFRIQDEIAAGVATALDAALVPRSTGAELQPAREAHDSFLRGEFFYYRRAPGDIDRAVSDYEAAVAREPAYARAWAALAGAYSYKALRSYPPQPELLEKQKVAAQRAVELDPKLAIAHIRLAQYYGESGQPGHGQHRAIAEQLDPGHPMVLSWAADAASERGDFKAAIAKLEQAVAREPLLTLYRNNLAVLLVADGQLDRALSEFRYVVELSADSEPGSQTDIVRILVLQGAYAEAKKALAALPERKRRDHGQALLFNAPGERLEADAAFQRLLGDADEGATEQEVNDTIQLAEAYAVRGNVEGAFATLESRLARYANNPGPRMTPGWFLRNEARVSPFLKPLHDDPRWAAFLKETG